MNEYESLTTFTNEELSRVERFTQLLCKVSPRVSTQKPTSSDALIQLGRGLIDIDRNEKKYTI